MKTICATLLLAMFWTSGLPAAQENAAPIKGNDFEAFKLIYERNIFNPNRRPPSGRGQRPDNPPPVRIDSFSLVGTMLYEQGAYAFFDGSEPEYRTVLNPSNTIAGFQVTAINPSSVKLCSGSNTLELAIGMQMRRSDGGDWKLSAGSSPGSSSGIAGLASPSTSGGPSASSSSKSPAESAGSDAGADEVLKRLMQKREQELNK